MQFVCSTIPSFRKEFVAQLVKGNWNCQRKICIPAKASPLSPIFFNSTAPSIFHASRTLLRCPCSVPAFDRATDLWNAIRNADIMVFHPYQSFDTVTRLVEEAASDPKVLAIKMTLYRVSPTSPIAQALRRAAEAGKEVSVLVELQARFDEEASVTVDPGAGGGRCPRRLRDGGLSGRANSKVCLVVRQEVDGIRRYCHLATGNYNARTSGIYSDVGLF